MKLVLSMTFQVFMGLWSLYQSDLCHDDLHGGNVLFKKIEDPASNYFVYTTPKGRRIAIQHQSHLFALTDYGLMKKAGGYKSRTGQPINKDVYSDFERICAVMARKLENEFPEISILLNDISDIAEQMNTEPDLIDPFEFLAGPQESTMIDVIVKNNVLDEWNQVVLFNRPRSSMITEIFDMS